MDDEDWKPPSEAELKVIKARRERADKISQVMGSYLLKGYKMLGSSCDNCGTILLQDRQQQLYCVACMEIDNEHSKDDPALSGEAARRQIEESGHRHSSPPSPPLTTKLNQPAAANTSHQVTVRESSKFNVEFTLDDEAVMTSNERVLRKTIHWAMDKLDLCQSSENCVLYTNLAKSCADTLLIIKQIKNEKRRCSE
ncbi:Protein ZNRD2 [Chamberlinius hualienensis]